MTRKLALVCGLLAVMLEPALADTAAAVSKVKHTFDISRDGSKIGTDVVEIDKQGDMTTVKFATHISVIIMYVEVYSYEHTASETWNGTQFVSFKSQTNDHGKKHVVSAAAVGDKINFEIDGKHSEAPRKILPGSFWNKSFLTASELFDETDGKRMTIKVSDLGEEAVTVNGVKRQAHHYRIAGGIERDLWFDGDTLIRLKLSGSDGSKIVSDLRS